MRTAVTPFLLVALVPAQVLVVDASNGPGTTFTSLAAATAAAPDGATLLVRAGAYAGPVVVAAKGLTILGDPGAAIAGGGLQVQNTQAAQPVVLRQLAVTSSTSLAFAPLAVAGCRGRVVVENVTVQSSVPLPSISGPPASLVVSQTPQLALRGCTFRGTAVVVDAHVSAEACSFAGRAALWGPSMLGMWSASPAIEVHPAAVVQLAGCTVQGGAGACFPLGCGPTGPTAPFLNEPALRMNGGTAVVRAPGAVAGGATWTQSASITGTGVVRVDPGVAVAGATTVTPAPQVAAMPSVQSAGAPPGGTITATASAAPGDFVLLVLGLPGPAVALPGVADPFWIDPTAHLYAALGTVQPLTAVLPVPANAALRGFTVAWQAVSFAPPTGLMASQPSLAFVF